MTFWYVHSRQFCYWSLLLFCGLLTTLPAVAASTVDTFSFQSVDQEQRYRGLIAEIRCPKCQNVNIAGSDAPIAKDLRVTVHRLLGEGMTDEQILAFLQARYGDFVLYDPPLRGNTLWLWLLPFVGFGGVIWVVLRLARRDVRTDQLSDDDQTALDELLRNPTNKSHTTQTKAKQTRKVIPDVLAVCGFVDCSGCRVLLARTAYRE